MTDAVQFMLSSILFLKVKILDLTFQNNLTSYQSTQKHRTIYILLVGIEFEIDKKSQPFHFQGTSSSSNVDELLHDLPPSHDALLMC